MGSEKLGQSKELALTPGSAWFVARRHLNRAAELLRAWVRLQKKTPPKRGFHSHSKRSERVILVRGQAPNENPAEWRGFQTQTMDLAEKFWFVTRRGLLEQWS